MYVGEKTRKGIYFLVYCGLKYLDQTNKIFYFDKSSVRSVTVDIALFFRGHDRKQMSSAHAAVLLRRLPALPFAEVTIAKALELLPARLTLLHI